MIRFPDELPRQIRFLEGGPTGGPTGRFWPRDGRCTYSSDGSHRCPEPAAYMIIWKSKRRSTACVLHGARLRATPNFADLVERISTYAP